MLVTLESQTLKKKKAICCKVSKKIVYFFVVNLIQNLLLYNVLPLISLALYTIFFSLVSKLNVEEGQEEEEFDFN